ncbi:MAG: helix-turn-helix transcriptional regulator [Clostridia bacterium]|nr:helix-turn-helix transcriptional regulator [Clostridia bacterium]
MFTAKDVAQLAIEYRIKNNLTQKELAEKLKISNQTLCHIEQEKGIARQITLQKIGNMLKDENF